MWLGTGEWASWSISISAWLKQHYIDHFLLHRSHVKYLFQLVLIWLCTHGSWKLMTECKPALANLIDLFIHRIINKSEIPSYLCLEWQTLKEIFTESCPPNLLGLPVVQWMVSSTQDQHYAGLNLSYATDHFDSPQVRRDWVIKDFGMFDRVCATGHIKDPLIATHFKRVDYSMLVAAFLLKCPIDMQRLKV